MNEATNGRTMEFRVRLSEPSGTHLTLAFLREDGPYTNRPKHRLTPLCKGLRVRFDTLVGRFAAKEGSNGQGNRGHSNRAYGL